MRLAQGVTERIGGGQPDAVGTDQRGVQQDDREQDADRVPEVAG
jgi:hypothetical protein